MKVIRRTLASVSVVASVLLASCTPSVQGLYVAPSFTFPAIMRSNIGVAGVAPGNGRITIARSIDYSNVVQVALQNKYPGISVMPAGDVVRAIGSNNYRKMLNYFSAYGVVPAADLTLIHQHIRRMQYLMFVRVTANVVTHNTSSNDTYNAKNVMTAQGMTYTSTRTLSLATKVYNLNTGRVVWSGTVSDDNSNSNNYSIPSVDAGAAGSVGDRIAAGVINDVANGVISKNYHYPNAPSTANVMKLAFSGVINKLPSQQQN